MHVHLISFSAPPYAACSWYMGPHGQTMAARWFSLAQ